KNSRTKRKRKYIPTENGKLKAVPIYGKHSKKPKLSTDEFIEEESDKSFSGGYVMEVTKPAMYENVVIVDFNSLYPNIMLSYFLCPSLLVLDPRYAKSPGVNYLKIIFNKKKVFLYAQNFPGVIIQ